MSDLPPPFSVPHALPAGERVDTVSFSAQLARLKGLLARRNEIVARIEQLLNCQGRPLEYQQDRALLAARFRECFAPDAAMQARLQLAAQLEQAHWAAGFKPRANAGNDIVEPVELLARGLHLWRQTRWPGHRGRLRFAHILFNLSLLRTLALLTLRLWDAAPQEAGARLARLQEILDALWRSTPADQPRLVRDVRWLLPVAMSPTTDDLRGYFHVMACIDATLPEADLRECHRAGVLTGAGHLRAQLYHLSMQRGLALDDSSLVLLTRKSNALDIALLLQGLVPLLAAYEQSLHSAEITLRRALADLVCQGISPDPELFLLRLDLLGPYSMIEHLFVTTDAAGQARYTASGERHRQLLQDYAALLGRVAQSLLEDCRHGRPGDGAYSPYGVLYGFSSNIIELLALKALQPDAETRFSMEDAFTAGDADKRAWVSAWRRLPHIKPEVVQQYDYPQPFAEAISARVEQALQQCVATAGVGAAPACGRLVLVPAAGQPVDARLTGIPALPVHYLVTSDPQLVAAGKAVWQDQDDLLHCRIEGEFLVSYQTPGGWLGISKDLLTVVLGAGQDVQLAGVPREAAETACLMCPNLAVLN